MAKWPDFETDSDTEEAFAPKPAAGLAGDDDFAPLELKKPLARGKASDLGDVTGIADALADLGHYDKGRHGNPPLVPETLFRSIEDFQKDQGLDVDGVMLPAGPTLGRINALLPKARPKRVRGDFLQSEPPKPPPAPLQNDDSAPAPTEQPRLPARVWQAQAMAPAAPGLGSESRPRGSTTRPSSRSPWPPLRTGPRGPDEPRMAPEDREPLRGDRDVTEGAGENRIVPVTPEFAFWLRVVSPAIAESLNGLDTATAAAQLVEIVPVDGPIEIPIIQERNETTDTRDELTEFAREVRNCLDRRGLRRCPPARAGAPDPCTAGNCDYSQRGASDDAGRQVPEQRINPVDQHGQEIVTARGANFADLQIRFCRTNRRLLFNSYTSVPSTTRPILQELYAAVRIIWNTRNGDFLFLFPKAGPGRRWDLSGLCSMLDDSIDELQRPHAGGFGRISDEVRRRLQWLDFGERMRP